MKIRPTWFMAAAALYAAAWFALPQMPFRVIRVTGPSMSPTYSNGQFLVTERSDQPVRRGDVVTFRMRNEVYIKRVFAVPGDTLVLVKMGKEWVLPVEQVGAHRIRIPLPTHTFTVPDGTVYVLSDNRSYETDSRTYGPVPVENLIGRAIHPRPRPES